MNDLEFPSYAPVYPIRKKIQPKQRRTKIPSWGNEQVKTVGQNQTAPEWEVKWILYDEDANVIDAFLEERAKYNQSFLWTPPGYPQNRYRCDSWSKSLFDAYVSEVNATFKRIYDYDNIITAKFSTGYYSLSPSPITFVFGYWIPGETGQFLINGSIQFGRTYILYSEIASIVGTYGELNGSVGEPSNYFADMSQQMFGWDRDFQVDWWGD